MLHSEPIKDVKPDQYGRINLGADLTKDVAHYKVFPEEDGSIRLIPYAEVPQCELWLYKNKQALSSVKRGIIDADNGKTSEIDWDEWED